MIQKQTYLNTIDKTGVLLVNTFHLYKGYNRHISFVGNFIKISIKNIKSDSLLKKKGKSIALITNTKFKNFKKDGSFLFFYENSCILLKKKLILRSKELIGPSSYSIKRKKLLYKFTGIL